MLLKKVRTCDFKDQMNLEIKHLEQELRTLKEGRKVTIQNNPYLFQSFYQNPI